MRQHKHPLVFTEMEFYLVIYSLSFYIFQILAGIKIVLVNIIKSFIDKFMFLKMSTFMCSLKWDFIYIFQI